MAIIIFIEPNGTRREICARNGDSLMRAATQAGVDGILAECGGAMTCLTCHCYVDPARFESLPPPTSEERALLEDVLVARANSRLSCQIVVREEMEGLVIRLPKWQG